MTKQIRPLSKHLGVTQSISRIRAHTVNEMTRINLNLRKENEKMSCTAVDISHYGRHVMCGELLSRSSQQTVRKFPNHHQFKTARNNSSDFDIYVERTALIQRMFGTRTWNSALRS